MVDISCHILAIVRCFENKDKKIDGKCFYEDCNLFLCTQCHDVHKQMPSLQKSQNFTRIKDALIIDKTFKYAEYWPSDLGNFENCFENKEKIKGNAFVNIAIYSFLPYIMTFTNKGHLCKSTKSYKGQECPNHNAAKAQNFQ